MSDVIEVIHKVADRLPRNISLEGALNIVDVVGTEFEHVRSTEEGQKISVDEIIDYIMTEPEIEAIIEEDEEDYEERILRMLATAEKEDREGNVKTGTAEDLFRDMEI